MNDAERPGDGLDDYDPKANAAAMERAGLDLAKGLLKAEMNKRRLTYAGLANLMSDYGIEENERNLRNKVSRGGFPASWFFAVMMMMEVKLLDISHSYQSLSDHLNSPNGD